MVALKTMEVPLERPVHSGAKWSAKAEWSIVEHSGAWWSGAPEPRLEGCAQPTVQGQSVAL